MGNRVKIIGAGIAGLSAGCYLQMNGYETEIYELHSIPGGLCTGWERMGYTFDGCIHWLVGSSPKSNFYHLWNELINMKKQKFVDHEIYNRIWDKTGEKYIDFFTDVDKLEEELVNKAPEDESLIRSFTGAIRRFKKLNMPVEKAREVMGPIDGIKTLAKFIPYIGIFKKWHKLSIEDFSKKFTNPLLREGIRSLFIPEMAMLFIIMNMSWMANRSAGYPIGGSLKFASNIAERYEKLGGKIYYNHRVDKILTYEGRATGIKLANGSDKSADFVISAADGYSTIFNMLDGKFKDKRTDKYYSKFKVFPSFIQVSLGLNREMAELEPNQTIPVPDKLKIDDSTTLAYLGIRIFNFDNTLARKGKTAITALIPAENYKYWVDLKKDDSNKYKREKKRITDEVIELLDNKFGDIKKYVEVKDVSTPASVIRYTNNWKGSFEGWILTPELGFGQMDKTLPGLERFYMIGQWVEPGGGIPPAMMSGRAVTQIICKNDHKEFITDSF